jgi:hypothetical protein
MGLITPQITINRGDETSNFAVDVSGTIRVSSASGANKMVVVDASGVLSSQSMSGADASGTGIVGLFGDGYLGDYTLSSEISLISDRSYNNLTINSGGIINTNGYVLRVRGTLTINSGGYIRCNGGNGYDGYPSPTSGYGGTAPYSTHPEFGVPGYGGDGGQAYGAGTTGNMGATYGSYSVSAAYSPPPFYRAGSGGGGGGQVDDGVSGQAATQGGSVWVYAGLGGDGKYGGYPASSCYMNGGGGGAGGGVCCVYAYTINNAGSIEAKGGNGGNGFTMYGADSGGGGGGGGGTVVVFYRKTSGSGVGSLSAAAGTTGTGGTLYGSSPTSGVTMSCRI